MFFAMPMRHRSLLRELLGWVIVPLALLVAFNVWTSYSNALANADLITNRTLVSSAKVIAERLRTENGMIEAPIPPAALEMFASEQHDLVVYKVIGPKRELIAGTPEIDTPRVLPKPFDSYYFDEAFREQPIRTVAITQPVVTDTGTVNVTILVGQTLHSRNSLVRQLWRAALRDQVLLVIGATVLILFGLRRGLTPLMRLRGQVESRQGNALEPLPIEGLQVELRPLVEALNEALAVIERQIATQRRFVANAAHQLRTPLALLRTQASVGLRTSELAEKDEALAGIDATVDRLARLSTQLLALARAEQGSANLRREPIDLVPVVQDSVGMLADLALTRRTDLGLDIASGDYRILGHAPLLGELVHNLVENALRYGPTGGRVTVSLASEGEDILLRVEDDGPGIPPAERERVFERFYRLLGTDVTGTGLGLAIVREIVASHEGDVTLGDRGNVPGLVASVRLRRLRGGEDRSA